MAIRSIWLAVINHNQMVAVTHFCQKKQQNTVQYIVCQHADKLHVLDWACSEWALLPHNVLHKENYVAVHVQKNL